MPSNTNLQARIAAVESACQSLAELGIKATIRAEIRVGEYGRLEVNVKTKEADDEAVSLCEGCGVLPGDPLCEICDGSLTGGNNV